MEYAPPCWVARGGSRRSGRAAARGAVSTPAAPTTLRMTGRRGRYTVSWTQARARGGTVCNAVGVFFSTQTGNTQEIAEWFAEEYGTEALDIGDCDLKDLEKCTAFVVGAPTWHTGSDVGRSGTSWDDVLDNIDGLDLAGKPCAIYGLGDSAGYSEYFCDAIEEVYQHFSAAGAKMVGETSSEGYTFDESKSQLENGNFMGLALDSDNESHMNEDRYNKFLAQIKSEGVVN